jgi:hypothetical protein
MSTPDKEKDHLCKIVGISGSVRPESYTTRAVALALKGTEELGCQTKLIDLREYQLVFCDGKDDESHFPEGVFRLREEVKHAKGVILGTPEYHGGWRSASGRSADRWRALPICTAPAGPTNSCKGGKRRAKIQVGRRVSDVRT